MGTLILVRHATTAASASGRNLGQRSDPPLAPEGHVLAEGLANALVAEIAELPRDEVRLLSSPAQRCRQTIEAVARQLTGEAPPIEIEPGLLEIDYGDWDGLTADECRAQDPDARRAWEEDPFENACPGGESGADVARRAFAIFEPLETWLAADRGRLAIVVAHNHVNRLRLCAILGWPMREYRDRLSQDPAGYSIIGFGSGPPVMRRVNAAPA
ncbi:MAG TPA: histidine phosphatase family protein [Candidatus Limnocylindria bacterium]|jgi:probable phosphoglycerate mutase